MSSFTAVFGVLLFTILYQCDGYCRDNQVAFSAQLSQDINVAKNGIVKFDQTTVNLENGYNARNGEFTAPRAGIYLFTFTISTRDWQAAQLLLNNDPKSFVEADTMKVNYKERSTATNTVMLQVEKGDRVYVQITNGDSKLSGKYSSFTGYLI